MGPRHLFCAIAFQAAVFGCSGATGAPGAPGAPPNNETLPGNVAEPKGGGGGICPFKSPPPKAPGPVNPNASPAEKAAAAQLVTLDALIGRFLRGEAIVYRGTMNATATMVGSALDGSTSGTTSASIPEGPAVAMLAFVSTGVTSSSLQSTGKTAVLMIHAPKAKLYIDLGEAESDPATLLAGGVGQDDPLHGIDDEFLITSCKSCGPNLWDRPTTLTFDHLTTTAVAVANVGITTDKFVNVTIGSDITAKLTRAEPCSLTWEELAAVNTEITPNTLSLDAGLSNFVSVDGNWVWHAQGNYESAPPRGRCSTYTDYTIDLYVDQSNLADYGSRNYKEGATSTSCGG